MENCTLDCIQFYGNFSQAATCDYVQAECMQDTINFVQGYYCLLNGSFLFSVIIGLAFLLFIYLILHQMTDQYLAPCVQEFIDKLHISKALAGVTFLAFANGAGDVITAIVAGTSSSKSTALIPFGSIFGAGLMCMAFIFSVVIQLSPNGELQLRRNQTIFPLIFYIVSTLYLMLVSVFYGKMNLYISGILIVIYIIYIITVLLREKKQNKQKANSEGVKLVNTILTIESLENDENEVEAESVAKYDVAKRSFHEEEKQQDEKQIQHKNAFKRIIYYTKKIQLLFMEYTIPPYSKASWKPINSIVSLALSPLVIALTQDIQSIFNKHLFDLPLIIYFSIPAALLLSHSAYCIVKKQTPEKTIVYTIYSFIVIVCWITYLCAALINVIELFQLLTNINSVFLGLTLLAGAGSIPDYLSITAFARKGYASTAVSAIFSGQLFNYLIGFGISLMIQSIDGEYEFRLFDIQGTTFEMLSNLIVLFVIGMALLYMIVILLFILKKKGLFGSLESKFTKLYYIIFVLIALVLSLLTDFYREVSCSL